MAGTKTNWSVVNMLQQNAARINCKGHFVLGENAKIEIAKVRKTRHSVYNINYHLVWIPKTRMRILTAPFKEQVEKKEKANSSSEPVLNPSRRLCHSRL